MPKASKSRKGYWRFDPTARVTPTHEDFVVQTRGCPVCTNGMVNRLAERQGVEPYHWKPIGWRCANCGTCYIDVEVRV